MWKFLCFVLLAVGTAVQSACNYVCVCLLKLNFNANDRSGKGRYLVHGVVGMLLV
jgi:hypothetical protein